MIKSPGLRRAIAVLLCFAAMACGPTQSKLSEKDRAALRAASAIWVDTYNRNDWAALAMEFMPDAIMMPPGTPAVLGRSEIGAWEAANETGFQIAFLIETIEGTGSFAAISGRSCVFIPDDTGSYAVDVGKFLETRVKQPSGRWLIHADSFNSDGRSLKDTCPFAAMPDA